MNKDRLYKPGEWIGQCFKCDDDGTNGRVNHILKRIRCLVCGFEARYEQIGNDIIVYEESCDA